ncbi:MAG: hypothetical protein ACP5E8_06500 [Thermoplasmata archaeon]
MNDHDSNNGRFVIAGLFIISFIVDLVILATDNNLKTDFGSVHPYFIHWYIFMFLDLITLVTSIYIGFFSSNLNYVKIGLIWSSIMVLIMVGDLLTYSSVGFSAPVQFAYYLFGFSKYPQSLSYIPGLYSLLFIVYIFTIIVSIFFIRSYKINNSI